VTDKTVLALLFNYFTVGREYVFEFVAAVPRRLLAGKVCNCRRRRGGPCGSVARRTKERHATLV